MITPRSRLGMGPAANPMAVVDDRLRVHGLSGLRVADAGVTPTVVSGNTNAACIMIGEKCVDLMLAARPAVLPGPPMKSSALLPGFDEIHLPGDCTHRLEQENRARGVPIHPALSPALA